MPLYIDEETVASLVTIEDTIDCISRAFVEWHAPKSASSPRQRVSLSPGSLNVMSGSFDDYFGLKSYFSNPHGGASHVLLYSRNAGRLVAMIEANMLGQLRTGAASGVATHFMARKDSTVLGQIGTGKQAIAQLRAVCAVRGIATARVFSRDRKRREAFALAMDKLVDAEVLPVDSARECVDGADVVTTITKSPEPVLHGDWLAPGTHINIAGANALSRREADDSVLARADLVATDDRVQARLEAAELVRVCDSGRLAWDDVVELGDIAAGRVAGRASGTAITVFKSLGVAVEDVALGALVYERASGWEF